MYLKIIRQTGAWYFGIEYLNAKVGDIIRVDTAVGMEMRRLGIAERALDREVAELDARPDHHAPERDGFQLLLSPTWTSDSDQEAAARRSERNQ